MSQIRNKNTKPEILVRKFLFAKGLRYRLNDKKLQGQPDVVLPKYKAVIFVNGCFWHGHSNCTLFKVPKTRSDWWLSKIARNKKRDVENNRALKKLGWTVIVIWECGLKPKKVKKTLDNLLNSLLYK